MDPRTCGLLPAQGREPSCHVRGHARCNPYLFLLVGNIQAVRLLNIEFIDIGICFSSPSSTFSAYAHQAFMSLRKGEYLSNATAAT